MFPFITHVLVISTYKFLYSELEMVKWMRGLPRHFVLYCCWGRIVCVSWKEYSIFMYGARCWMGVIYGCFISILECRDMVWGGCIVG